MKIRLKKIYLKNFKAFEEMTIYSNESFNIIIGENSVGKSTIFEAIHLWEKCYQTLILESRKGFYKVKKTSHRYVNYQDIDFLRLTSDADLFHKSRQKVAEISLLLLVDDEEIELGFKISTPTSIANAFLRVQPINESSFTNFAEKMKAASKYLDEVIFIYQTRPIAVVPQQEPYLNETQVKKKIQRGMSHEVLRNKIVSRRESISELEKSISEVLGKAVKFELPARTREKKEEFISLKVSIGSNKAWDLHLQGSGFLQIAEILSTIEFANEPLKLLLVDEPDSHIHSKLQHNLIQQLRKISDNQFFIITHNDQFVTNSNDDEVFFLSDTAKAEKILKPMPTNSFDVIKSALGGVVLPLELLNQAETIAFVESNVDEAYLKAICSILVNEFNYVSHVNKFKFFPLRGRNGLETKITNIKSILSELFKGKNWITICDKDFSTIAIDQGIDAKLTRLMGEGSIYFSHSGYCFESMVFNDLDKFKIFVKKQLPGTSPELISELIDQQVENRRSTVHQINSDMYSQLKLSFTGQRNTRPEYENLQFDDLVSDWTVGGDFHISRMMNKDQICAFVLEIEAGLSNQLFQRDSNDPEEVSKKLLNIFIESIDSESDLDARLLDFIKKSGMVS